MEGDSNLSSSVASFRYPRIIQTDGSPTVYGSPTTNPHGYFSVREDSAMLGAFPSSPNGTHTGHIFEELLDAEVAVNVGKLREAARHGIDPAYRSTVYRYLLGVAFADKSREMTMERELEKDFDGITAAYEKLWLPADGDGDGVSGGRRGGKGDGKRALPYGHYLQPRDGNVAPLMLLEDSKGANPLRCYVRGTAESHAAWGVAASRLRHTEPYTHNAERRKRLDATLSAFQVYYSSASQYDVSNILALMLPFDEISAHARDVFFCTQSLYYLLTHYGNILQDRRSLQTHCGNLLLLFRTTNVTLHQHFFAEGVTVLEWVPGMLITLLAGRLHNDDLLRLWDCYLADIWNTLSVPLHPYVVLAILAEMTEELIECEKSEILSRLKQLPRIDAASIWQSATSIRESVYSKGLL